MAKEGAPPSYDSMFGQLTKKKEESDGVLAYTKGAAEVISQKTSNTVGACLCGTICSLLGLALPVAEIVIGAIHVYHCSAQNLLPKYLLVAGAVSIFTGGIGSATKLVSRKKTEDSEECQEDYKTNKKARALSTFTGMASMFSFIWFLCGTAWVFMMQECPTTDNLLVNSTSVDCFTKEESFSQADFYCNRLLFDFVFYETIAKWALGALLFVLGMSVCCCICCVFCCCAAKAKREQQDVELSGANNKSYST